MHIIHIASEMAPVAKVGGLGDVILGLCRELSWKGHDVDIIIPNYDCKNGQEIRDLSINYENLMSYYEGEWHSNTVWMGWVENLRVYFIEPHHNRYFFNRSCFYGCEDDIERYLYFCRAAMEFIYKKQLNADILHVHDWQAAIIPTLYREMYMKLGYTKPHTVFTIHNMEYQGICSPKDLDKIGLNGKELLTYNKLQDPQNSANINLLKSGIVFSDHITTVSPSYAKEVMTPIGGKGLEAVLTLHQNKFSGILNGIDYSYWNPEIDRYLPAHYSSRELQADKNDYNTLDKKAFIKKTLRERLVLEETHRPIVGCIARLVPQKGIDLIEHAFKFVIENQGQFVLLGSSPIPEIQQKFHKLKCLYAGHPHVHFALQQNEELAHLVYAGADMFIIPSLFEPCGLTQMIALKYGTIPIVRRTGGLADTVFDVDTSNEPIEKCNGYTFDLSDPKEIEEALYRAIDCWLHNQQKWRRLVLNGMNLDFSWNHPSDAYLKIYKNICKEK